MLNQPAQSTGRYSGLTRRQVLKSASAGFGYLALAGMLGQHNPQAAAATGKPNPGPLAPKAPHFPVKAKRIIFLFMEGAASQMDTWEYKPQLQKNDGRVGPGGGTLTASKFKFSQHGQTATWISELYPNVAKQVDKLCFVRGLYTDTPAHPQAVIQLHTGTALASLTRPSMGSWLLYGLGTENQDLPGYITINPPANFGGAVNYGSAFLPAHFQGTRINDTGYLPNLKAQTSSSLQRKQLDLLQAMNRDLAETPGADRSGGSDPVLRVGLQDAVEGAGTARHFQRAAEGTRRLWREGWTGGKLRAPVLDGSTAERGGRTVR